MHKTFTLCSIYIPPDFAVTYQGFFLLLLNDGSHTYLHPGHATFSAIDLTICEPELLIVDIFLHGKCGTIFVGVTTSL